MRGNKKYRSVRKDKRAFTGLEAAIVLTAFVVVAAVFSYVVLNAGFFTTQKAKEVVHTGVESATSSVELAGDAIGHGNDSTNKMTNVTFYLQLTAGQNPVNINKTTLTYTSSSEHGAMTSKYGDDALSGTGQWNFSFIGADSDKLLERNEKVEIHASLPESLAPNREFMIEVKPPTGAVLGMERTVPAAIYTVMNLH